MDTSLAGIGCRIPDRSPEGVVRYSFEVKVTVSGVAEKRRSTNLLSFRP